MSGDLVAWLTVKCLPPFGINRIYISKPEYCIVNRPQFTHWPLSGTASCSVLKDKMEKPSQEGLIWPFIAAPRPDGF